MRKIYTISYNFKNPDDDRYAGFVETLTGFGSWCHYLRDTWLIATDLTAKQIFSKLEPFVGEDLYLLIAEVGSDFSGWLPKKAWEWINARTQETSGENLLSPSASS